MGNENKVAMRTNTQIDRNIDRQEDRLIDS